MRLNLRYERRRQMGRFHASISEPHGKALVMPMSKSRTTDTMCRHAALERGLETQLENMSYSKYMSATHKIIERALV